MTGIIVAACLAMVGKVFIHEIKNIRNNKQPNNTTIINDTIKKDSIKPVLKDAFNAGKKVIKF